MFEKNRSFDRLFETKKEAIEEDTVNDQELIDIQKDIDSYEYVPNPPPEIDEPESFSETWKDLSIPCGHAQELTKKEEKSLRKNRTRNGSIASKLGRYGSSFLLVSPKQTKRKSPKESEEEEKVTKKKSSRLQRLFGVGKSKEIKRRRSSAASALLKANKNLEMVNTSLSPNNRVPRRGRKKKLTSTGLLLKSKSVKEKRKVDDFDFEEEIPRAISCPNPGFLKDL